MMQDWSDTLPVMQIRIARPTRDINAIRKFYGDALGLEEIGGFQDHDGYDGIMYGLPNQHYHLEFTQHANHDNLPPSHEDSLLVIYIPNKEAIGRLVVRLGAKGFYPVAPKNSYWEHKGVTFEDPDGWRLVLFESEGISGKK